MPRADLVIANFQTDTKMRDDLRALAKSRERSISAEIRLAIRAHLKEHWPAGSHLRRQRRHQEALEGSGPEQA
jgi:hypothetical protein